VGGLGVAGIVFGPIWTFGVRSRKKAVVLFVIATVALLLSGILPIAHLCFPERGDEMLRTPFRNRN
jgi:predicted membrane protein